MYRTGNPGHIAVIMMMTTLAILVVGAIGVKAGIQRRILTPPQLDLRVGSLHLLAYSMGPQQVPACASRSPILNDPNSFAACSQQFYVVLVLMQAGAPDNKLWILQLLNLPMKQILPAAAWYFTIICVRFFRAERGKTEHQHK